MECRLFCLGKFDSDYEEWSPGHTNDVDDDDDGKCLFGHEVNIDSETKC